MKRSKKLNKKLNDAVFSQKPSDVAKFRKKFLMKNIELVNITPLCTAYLGDSGWCNDFNEPDETIHHVQLRYRGDTIANVGMRGVEVIDDDLHVCFDAGDGDFIIFRKIKMEKVK